MPNLKLYWWSELELHIAQTDRSMACSAKFERKLKNCLEATIQNQDEDLSSEEDIWPVQEQKVRPVTFESEDDY